MLTGVLLQATGCIFLSPTTELMAGERKANNSPKFGERKLLLWFLLNWAQQGGSTWELLVLEACRAGGRSCSWELIAGLGSGAVLVAVNICQMAERKNEEGAEYTDNSPMGVPEFGLRGR